MDRREFTNASVMALLSGLTVTISGCSESPSSPSPNGGGASGTRTASISVNHGHAGSVSSAQISAGNQISVDIRGEADHPHTVVLTMADLNSLAAGQPVTKPSSTDQSAIYGQHQHMVTFS